MTGIAARQQPDHETYRLEEQIGYLLGRAQAVALGNLRQQVGELDLTPPQLGAVLRLMELGEASQNELGRQSGMKPATVHGVVQRLQKRGLVDSRPSPHDQRRRLLFLTDAGQDMALTLADHSRTAANVTLSSLSVDEQSTLTALLKKVIGGP